MAYGPKPKPIKDRLFAQREIDLVTQCWNWTGGCNHKGYGKIGIDGKTVTTHRASYLEFKGEIPAGKIIRHTCDNRKCFNPEHLITGDNRDNWRDALNRQTRDGLSDNNCLQLFLMRRWGISFTDIGLIAGQSEATIRSILDGTNRGYLGKLYENTLAAAEEATSAITPRKDIYSTLIAINTAKRPAFLTREKCKEIREFLDKKYPNGQSMYTQRKIAEIFSISQSLVSQVARGINAEDNGLTFRIGGK